MKIILFISTLLLLTICSLLFDEELNHEVITVDYDTAIGSKTSMDVVIPKSASGNGSAVFLVHGGG